MKSDQLVEILSSLGPCLSSQLSQAIQSKSGVTAVAARKQIERAKETFAIQSFGALQLKHGEQFLYLREQGDTPAFRRALFKALEDSKSAYGRVLSGVTARGGIVPEFMFATVSGLPVQADNGQHTAESSLDLLTTWGLLRYDLTKVGLCVLLHPDIASKRVGDRRLAARLMIENLVLAAIGDWFRLQGLIGTQASKRGDSSPPQFGYYQWDFVAPSYISALRAGSTESKINPGFIVADVILGRILSVEDVRYFVEKSNAIRRRLKNRPFIPFLIADWFDIEALNLGRKHGLTFTTVKNMFGKPVYQAINSISQIVEDTASIDAKAQDFVDLVYSIAHMSSALEEAKSTIFELIVSSLMTLNQYTYIEHHRIFNDLKHGLRCSADILVHTETSIKIARCNAYEPSPESIHNWFAVIVPIIHSVLVKQEVNRFKNSFQYMYYSTSALTAETADLLNKINSQNLGYKVAFIDKMAITMLVADLPKLQRLFQILINGAPGDNSEDFLSHLKDE